MPPPQRDDISFAFQHSSYATPYGDNIIPGNHPGHRERKLGRAYAPDPINISSLHYDLHIPSTALGHHGPAYPCDINNHMNSLLLPRDLHNGNYILDSERGGRRHFEEYRGAEMSWVPSLRPLNPPISSNNNYIPPMRRAYGTYNYLNPTPEVKEMMMRREREANRQFAGKAIVDRRPDHHPLDLGFCHFYAVRGDSSEIAANNNNNNEILKECKIEDNANKEKGEISHVSAGEMTGSSGKNCALPFLGFSSPSWDESRLCGVYKGTRREYNNNNNNNMSETGKFSMYTQRRKREEAERARQEEIHLVKLLPK